MTDAPIEAVTSLVVSNDPPQSGPLQTEPVRIAGLITNFLLAILGLVAAFGLDVSDTQRQAILGAILPTIVFVQFAFELARTYVTPVPKAQAAIDQAFVANPATEPKPTL